MTISIKETITTTGAGTSWDVGPPKTLSFAIISDGFGVVADVEVKLTKDGTWLTAEAGVADSEIKTTTGPVVAVRLNVSNMGSASAIDFELCGERQ